jgi:hypothetical protein
MAQIVNVVALGIPASDTNGNEIPWSLWMKSSAVALDFIGNTQILGRVSNDLGYMATLPYTYAPPSGPELTVMFLDSVANILYAPAGETPTIVDLSKTAALLDAVSGHFYAAPGLTPSPSNLSSVAGLVDAVSGNFYAAANAAPYPANLGMPTVFLSAELGAYATPGSIS